MDRKPKDIRRIVNRTVRITVVEEEETVIYQGELDRKRYSDNLPVWYVMDDPVKIYQDGTEEQTTGHKVFRESDLEKYIREGKVDIIEEPGGKCLLRRRA